MDLMFYTLSNDYLYIGAIKGSYLLIMTKNITSTKQESCNNFHRQQRIYWTTFIPQMWPYYLVGIYSKQYPALECWENHKDFWVSINPYWWYQVFESIYVWQKMSNQSSTRVIQSYPLTIRELSVCHQPYRYYPSFPWQCQCCWWTYCSFQTLMIGFSGRGLLSLRRLRCSFWLVVLWCFVWSCLARNAWRRSLLTRCPFFIWFVFILFFVLGF